MRSLRDISLSRFSYDKLRDLCFDQSNNISTIFDCDWDIWRDKAHADFGITPEYFDLIHTLPGSQRYLQIKSYFVTTPDLAVKVYPNGSLEGVYEAAKGFVQAVEEYNIGTAIFFASRLKEEKRKILLEQLEKEYGEYEFLTLRMRLALDIISERYGLDISYMQEFMEAWQKVYFGVETFQWLVQSFNEWDVKVNYSEEMERQKHFWYYESQFRKLVQLGNREALEILKEFIRNGVYNDDSSAAGLLYSVISSGRIDFLDYVIHDFFTLPENFSIAKDVPKANFWEPPVRINLPQQTNFTDDFDISHILVAALKSFNVQMIDFIVSVLCLPDDYVLEKARNNVSFKNKHKKNPEGEYTVYVRYPVFTVENYFETDNVEILQDIFSKGNFQELQPLYGNIPAIITILPFIKNKDISEKDSILYPLTARVLEE